MNSWTYTHSHTETSIMIMPAFFSPRKVCWKQILY